MRFWLATWKSSEYPNVVVRCAATSDIKLREKLTRAAVEGVIVPGGEGLSKLVTTWDISNIQVGADSASICELVEGRLPIVEGGEQQIAKYAVDEAGVIKKLRE